MTKTTLQKYIKDNFNDDLFLVVSNRQPISHFYEKGRIVSRRTPGGVVTAIEPIIRTCNGTWIALGSGEADRAVTDEQGLIRLPQDNPEYTLKRVWLPKEDVQGYYYGYSNETLWPLCHNTFQRPKFRKEDWEAYVRVNRKFAEEAAAVIGRRRAFVWVHDFHLCLFSKFLKELKGDDVFVAHFWHIPWPAFETFRICPQKHEILEGLLSNDLLGFQITYHERNFIDVVERELECRVDHERRSIIRRDRQTFVRSYPISIDFDDVNRQASSQELKDMAENLKSEFGIQDQKIMVGVDRIDYTKGIPERLLAIDRLFEKHPELKEKIVFVQMGALSRIHLQTYKDLNEELNRLVESINWKHQAGSWKPVILVRRQLSLKEVIAFYRMAQVGVISSLHDGMNLVAKEFAASCFDLEGVLVLSCFTGASRELPDAVLINPYDREGFSDGLYQAVTMDTDEKHRRIKNLRAVIKERNVFKWASDIMDDMQKLKALRSHFL